MSCCKILGAIFFWLLFLEVGLAVGLCFCFLVFFLGLLFVVLLAFDFFPTRPPFSSFFFLCLPPSLSGVSSVLLCVCVCVQRVCGCRCNCFVFGTDLGSGKQSSYINFFGSQSYKNYSHTTKHWRFRPSAYHLSFFLVLLLDGVLQRK